MSCPRARVVVAALLAIATSAIHAQDSLPRRDSATSRMVMLGSAQEDRMRVGMLVGKTVASTFLIRAPSTFSVDTASLGWRRPRVEWLGPSLDLTSNSSLPFSLNDGAMWASRGLSVSAATGVHAGLWRVRANIRPLFWATQNKPYPVLPATDTTRSAFSSPFHFGVVSADLPLRFGVEPIDALDLGESALWFTSSRVAAGISNESQWWGPGLRNAIVMSNNAGGIPHAFVRTPSPIETRWGDVEARYVLGGLTESRFFDRDVGNDYRSLSAAVVTFSPAVEPDATLGVARAVYGNLRQRRGIATRALDVLVRWNRSSGLNAAEQLLEFFGQWRFPASGAEVYAEWSRQLMPLSLKDFIVGPQMSQGITLGAQWLPVRSPSSQLRLQVEFTNLEHAAESGSADTITYYASSEVIQGYTQRGQVIGAAIGPGSSSQWIAADYMAREWSIGAFLGRIRWATDAYYDTRSAIGHFSYDATVLRGVRGSARLLGRAVAFEVSKQHRYNYLFQNSAYGYARTDLFDRENMVLSFRLTP